MMSTRVYHQSPHASLTSPRIFPLRSATGRGATFRMVVPLQLRRTASHHPHRRGSLEDGHGVSPAISAAFGLSSLPRTQSSGDRSEGRVGTWSMMRAGYSASRRVAAGAISSVDQQGEEVEGSPFADRSVQVVVSVQRAALQAAVVKMLRCFATVATTVSDPATFIRDNGPAADGQAAQEVPARVRIVAICDVSTAEKLKVGVRFAAAS